MASTAEGAPAPERLERQADEPDGFGLGVGQQALWFLDRLAPELSTAYDFEVTQ